MHLQVSSGRSARHHDLQRKLLPPGRKKQQVRPMVSLRHSAPLQQSSAIMISMALQCF